MKEFDVFLNRHLTECDVTVYALPFRERFAAGNGLVIATDPINIYCSTPLGRCVSGMEVCQWAGEYTKTALEKAAADTVVDSTMRGVASVIYEGAAFQVGPTSKVVSVARSVNIAGETAMQIEGELTTLVTAVPLGGGESALTLNASMQGVNSVRKNLTVDPAVALAASVTGSRERIMVQAETGVELGADATFTASRLRMLSELDDMTLQEMDGSTLHELDYVAL